MCSASGVPSTSGGSWQPGERWPKAQCSDEGVAPIDRTAVHLASPEKSVSPSLAVSDRKLVSDSWWQFRSWLLVMLPSLAMVAAAATIYASTSHMLAASEQIGGYMTATEYRALLTTNVHLILHSTVALSPAQDDGKASLSAFQVYNFKIDMQTHDGRLLEALQDPTGMLLAASHGVLTTTKGMSSRLGGA